MQKRIGLYQMRHGRIAKAWSSAQHEFEKENGYQTDRGKKRWIDQICRIVLETDSEWWNERNQELHKKETSISHCKDELKAVLAKSRGDEIHYLDQHSVAEAIELTNCECSSASALRMWKKSVMLAVEFGQEMMKIPGNSQRRITQWWNVL